jgi:hypothetical protein
MPRLWPDPRDPAGRNENLWIWVEGALLVFACIVPTLI